MSDSCNTIKLPDGRRLSFFEFGAPEGEPVFYIHGGGVSSGLYAKCYHDAALVSGVRLIAPDRPGIGTSDRKDGRVLSDWPDDLNQLAGSLGISSYSVVSESAGSAYAYACMHKSPEQVKKAAIVSGLCPMDIKALREGLPFKSRLALGLMARSPAWLLKSMFSGVRKKMESKPEAFFDKMGKRVPAVEREILSSELFRNVYRESILNVFRQDAGSIVQDIRICSGSWGFGPENIKNEVHIWHGEKDTSAPVIMTRRMEKLIPNCRAAYLPGDTHMSVLQCHAREILSALV